MGIIDKPHDKFFKENMSNIDTAKDFMLNYLPKDILKIIDLDSLSLEKDSFIDEKYLFSKEWGDRDNSRTAFQRRYGKGH